MKKQSCCHHETAEIFQRSVSFASGRWAVLVPPTTRVLCVVCLTGTRKQMIHDRRSRHRHQHHQSLSLHFGELASLHGAGAVASFVLTFEATTTTTTSSTTTSKTTTAKAVERPWRKSPPPCAIWLLRQPTRTCCSSPRCRTTFP